MTSLTDQQLLLQYTEQQSEAAFAELTHRHVDLVYSAAVRMVCDSHLAQDVTDLIWRSFKKGLIYRRGRMSTETKTPMVEPYLFFDGRCEEALEFYRHALGAEVTALMRFKESPDPEMCTGVDPNKVMHAVFRIGGTQIMASDGRCEGKEKFQGFALSLSVPTEAEADQRFNSLAQGGEVQMPLTKTFYSPRFGMVTDRFGVLWMIIVPQAEEETQLGGSERAKDHTVFVVR